MELQRFVFILTSEFVRVCQERDAANVENQRLQAEVDSLKAALETKTQPTSKK